MFLHHLVEMGGFELNHHWHGINVLSILEFVLLAAVFSSVLAVLGAWVRESKRFIAISLAAALSFSTAAYAANTALSNLSASGALAGANLIYVVQTAGTGGVKATMTQVATFINSLFSGDCTVASGGAVTCTGPTHLSGTAPSLTAGNVTTNANLTGAITSVGNAASLGSFSSANLSGALTDETGSGAAVFGTAPTISSLNASVAMTLAFLTGGGTQCLQVSNTGVVSATGSACGSGSAGVSSIAGNTGAFTLNSASGLTNATNDIKCQASSASQFGCAKPDGSTITATAGVLTAVPGVTSRTVTGATDTILAADRGNVVYYNSASSIAVSQPAPSGSFAAGFFTTLCQINVGVPTVTPGSGTIDGGATYALPAGTAASPSCISYQSDGTNFNAVDLQASYGANVQAALGKALSAAGGVSSTIFHGTAVLGTSAIASGACATVVTVTAANVATTDVVSASYNGDPTAVTGYGASATGAVLSIYPYPTSGNILVKVCNSTSGSITPGAMTLNVSAVR